MSRYLDDTLGHLLVGDGGGAPARGGAAASADAAPLLAGAGAGSLAGALASGAPAAAGSGSESDEAGEPRGLGGLAAAAWAPAAALHNRRHVAGGGGGLLVTTTTHSVVGAGGSGLGAAGAGAGAAAGGGGGGSPRLPISWGGPHGGYAPSPRAAGGGAAAACAAALAGAPPLLAARPHGSAAAARGAPLRLRAAAYVGLNIASTCGIVFANKLVLGTYAFAFPVALTLIHAAVTAGGMEAAARAGLLARKAAPARGVLPLAGAYAGSIVLSNASIHLNTVRAPGGGGTGQWWGGALW
jgi:hypothetical protein